MLVSMTRCMNYDFPFKICLYTGLKGSQSELCHNLLTLTAIMGLSGLLYTLQMNTIYAVDMLLYVDHLHSARADVAFSRE